MLRDWIADFRETMNPPVFLGAAGLIIVFVIHGAVFTDHARATFEAAQSFTIETFGWFYIVTATAILAFVVWLGFSRFGAIRLGGDEANPEFSNITWLMMLYAMLEHLPLSAITSALGAVLIVIFFVTSSDSGSLVDVMVTRPESPARKRSTRKRKAATKKKAAARPPPDKG